MGFQEIEEAPAFSKVGLAHKPPIPDIEECQLSQPRQHPSHANSALRKSRAVCRSADSNHLSHAISALNEAQNSKRKFWILKRPLLYRDVSASVKLHICVRKSRAIYQKFLEKRNARENYC
ncbi:hypothetical protein COP2_033195 [Malus domestica]